MPALIELPVARLMVALSISVFYLVIQHEYKPYTTAEHNFLAQLAGTQITATLLFIGVQSATSIPRIWGFVCIVLNVILVPLVAYFNARRLKRRKDVLHAFLVERKDEHMANQTPSEFFDPSSFNEYWKAGVRSEFEVFGASFRWIDAALERPVSYDRWGQILYTLEHMPLSSSANADVRLGMCSFSCTCVPFVHR